MKNYRGLLGLIFLMITVCFVRVDGQELKVGDTLPGYRFESVLRYSTPSMGLDDFKGKILVLDFWRTTCGHAVSSFAHFDSLEREFPGQVAAVAVTTESRARITDYLANNVYAKETAMPVITDDTVLSGKRIPFSYIPHIVLVNENSVIVAITDVGEITSAVISKMLLKQPVSLSLKHEVTDFDYTTPILAEGKGRNLGSVAYTSSITHQLPGVMDIAYTDSSANGIFYKAYNQTIAALYAQAFHIPTLMQNRLILPDNDNNRFYKPTEDNDKEWQRQNLWCYNLILPAGYTSPERYAIEDFNRFFRVKGYMQKRRMKCLLLVKKGTGERWRAKPSNEYVYADSAGYRLIHNVSMDNVVMGWDAASSIPILNQSGLSAETADMTLTGTPDDLLMFRKELQRYDLDLVPSTKDIDVLVIEQK